MSYNMELHDAMDKLLANHPELLDEATPNINELRYFLLFQEYIDFDPTDDEIGLAHAFIWIDHFTRNSDYSPAPGDKSVW